MASSRQVLLQTHKAEAVRDMRYLLNPESDTCEVVLREMALKWWTVFLKKSNNYSKPPPRHNPEHFRHDAGQIYRHALHYLVAHADPGEGGNVGRRNFLKFTQVLMRNVPPEYLARFLYEWHTFHGSYLETYIASDTELATAKRQKEIDALKRMHILMKDTHM
ncbi:hypothetical protein AB5N19_05453 [Seiridium cardinale]|uniref:Uncharacterized protein n=1 Tax=Seiridium cardinale TaxID=138064 RepID=A0ABR2XIQ4_9PEZI